MARTARPVRTTRRQRRRTRPRPGAAGLLAAAVLGGAVASVGMVATGTGTAGPVPTPAALVSPAPPAAPAPADPQPAAPGSEPAPAPRTLAEQDKALVSTPPAEAFIAAMRAADIPTSRSGIAEVYTARAACAELAKGATVADLARRIPPGLPTVTKKQAATLVTLAQKHYC